MKTASIYYCKTRTEATDRANLWYIASPKAYNMENTPNGYIITNKKGTTLAKFVIL